MDKCSFCERKRNEVEFLISGVTGFICDECTGRAYEIVEEEHKDKKSKTKFDINSVQLKKPKEIKAFLDQYIIGQDQAKKVLSVASLPLVSLTRPPKCAREMNGASGACGSYSGCA